MFRNLNRCVPALLCLAFLGAAAYADDKPADSGTTSAAPTQRELMRQRWQSMTPEQRTAAKAKLKARMEKMTPEQRERLRQRMQEKHGTDPAATE